MLTPCTPYVNLPRIKAGVFDLSHSKNEPSDEAKDLIRRWAVDHVVQISSMKHLYDYICIYRLVQASGTTYDGVGVGWDVNVHVNLRQQLMLRTRGVGWDVNVHVNLRQQLMLRTRGVGGGGVGC